MADRGRDLRDAAAAFMRRYDRAGKRHQARAVELWEQAAGPQVAARTRATAVREGELQVHVDSHAWATELTVMGPQFVQAINAAAGQELVRSIRFTVTRSVESERRRHDAEREHEAWPERDKVRPEPLDDAEMERVERSVSAIADEDLRAAARRAMTADLEWKKSAEGSHRRSENGREKASSEG